MNVIELEELPSLLFCTRGRCVSSYLLVMADANWEGNSHVACRVRVRRGCTQSDKTSITIVSFVLFPVTVQFSRRLQAVPNRLAEW